MDRAPRRGSGHGERGIAEGADAVAALALLIL